MRLPALLPALLSTALAAPTLLPLPASTPPGGAPIPITGAATPTRVSGPPIRVGGTVTPGAALIGPSQPTSGGGTLTLASLPTPTSSPTPALPPARVTVRPGDTLSSLARRYQTSVPDLQRLNALTGSAISAGQVLRVPAPPCGVLTCAATPAGYLAPDGTVVRYTATTVTLTGTSRALWPELTRAFISGDPLPIYTALLRPCPAGSAPHPLIRCPTSDSVTLTLP